MSTLRTPSSNMVVLACIISIFLFSECRRTSKALDQSSLTLLIPKGSDSNGTYLMKSRYILQ